MTIGSDWTMPVALPHAILSPTLAATVLPPDGFVAMWPHAEPPIPIAWPPGFMSHHLTTSVFHKGSVIAQNHHDCGSGVLHACIPPDNLFLSLFFAFSKRKIEYGASTVRMQGHETGLATSDFNMLNCADIVSLPINWSFTSGSNTVYVGVTAADIENGRLATFTQIAFEFVLFLLGPHIEHLLPKKLGETALHFAEKLILFLLKSLKTHVVDSALEPDNHGHGESASHDASAETGTHAHVIASPFGDATMTVSAAEDGAYSVTSEAPGADGSRRSVRSDGLPLFPSSGGAGPGAPSFVDPLVRLVSEAPLL